MEKNRAHRNKWFRQIVLLGPIAVNAAVALTGCGTNPHGLFFACPWGFSGHLGGKGSSAI